MSNKKGIEKHCEYLESKIRKKQSKIDELRQENQRIKEQLHQCSLDIQELTERDIECPSYCDNLKQRDEVIEECIESIQNFMTHIDDGFCADMMTFIDILQKYKGDNK